MRKSILYAAGILLLFTAQSQNADFLNTPKQAVRTHLFYLQDDNYNDSLASLPFRHPNLTREESRQEAVKLKQVLDGTGTFIDMEELPSSPNYFDSTLQAHRYVLTEKYPDIELVRRDGLWRYPLSALNAIEVAHEELFAFGTARLLNLLPKLGTHEVMGLYLYQYVAILILALVAVVVQRVLTFLFNRLLVQFVRDAGYKLLAKGYLLPIAKPLSLFVVLSLIMLFIPALQLPPQTAYYVTTIMKVLIPLFGTIVFYRFINVLGLYLERMAEKTEGTLDDQLVPLIRKTLKTFIVIIGGLFILGNLNIDILPLLTGLSIGGLAFALAAQDTIKNFFGSLMIFIDKPFQIGDWITSEDIDGSVEEVGFRSSRIRTFRDSLMYVPNGKLADRTIDNHGLRNYRRFFTTIAVTYDTPPQLMETFIEGLRKIVEKHPDTRKDFYNIFFNDMGAYSLNIMFYIFFQVPDWTAELKARHEVLIEIMSLAEQLGINFAFPTQTLHMENFPGKPSLSPEYMGEDAMKKTIGEYFK